MSERGESGVEQDWDRNTRSPVPLPPPKSCDCQFHIFGDRAKYPFHIDTDYPTPKATFADIRGVLKMLGLSRGVVVTSYRFDIDHSLLIDEFEALSAAERANFRAIGVVRDALGDQEMAKLNALGVCGARFNLGKRYKVANIAPEVRRSMARVREIGWHARLHMAGSDIPEWGEVLRAERDLNMSIDHMGHIDFSLGTDQPSVRWIMDRLKEGNWWVMLSNGNRDSKMDAGWDDAVPLARTFIEAAPDRMIWGTDWPHTRWRKRMMNDAEVVELLYRYVDNDQALLKKILVDNPAKLHGFKDRPA
jgi:predicted TIM-barrel fold metal-dependent hydrolase